MEKEQKALDAFGSGFNCSQAVLGVYCEDLGLDKASAMKLACGLGGGFRQAEVCGAVSGAVMVLGLFFGQAEEGDLEAKRKTYALTKEFNKRFAEEHGSIVCRRILGYDLSVDREYEILKQEGLFQKICPELIRSALRILSDMIGEYSA